MNNKKQNNKTLFNDINSQVAAYDALKNLFGVNDNKYKSIYTSSMTDEEIARLEYEISAYEGSEEIFLLY